MVLVSLRVVPLVFAPIPLLLIHPIPIVSRVAAWLIPEATPRVREHFPAGELPLRELEDYRFPLDAPAETQMPIIKKRNKWCKENAVGQENRGEHDRVDPISLLVHIAPRRIHALRLGGGVGFGFTKVLTHSL